MGVGLPVSDRQSHSQLATHAQVQSPRVSIQRHQPGCDAAAPVGRRRRVGQAVHHGPAAADSRADRLAVSPGGFPAADPVLGMRDADGECRLQTRVAHHADAQRRQDRLDGQKPSRVSLAAAGEVDVHTRGQGIEDQGDQDAVGGKPVHQGCQVHFVTPWRVLWRGKAVCR